MFLNFKTLVLFYKKQLKLRTNPHSEMVGNIAVCISSAITASLRAKSYGISPFNPRLYGEDKIVAPGSIFKCTEFGTIKIRVVQYLLFSEVFNRTFKAQPTEDDMLLHLTSCHVG